MASVGAATFANGYVALLPTMVGRRAFIGNAAFVPGRQRRSATARLIGVATVPPDRRRPDGTAWLGSPAMNLPAAAEQRQLRRGADVPPAATAGRAPARHRVRPRDRCPRHCSGVGAYLYLWVLSALARGRDLLFAGAAVAADRRRVRGRGDRLLRGGQSATLIGTYRPRVEPLWSKFVRRSEFVTGLYEAAAVPSGSGCSSAHRCCRRCCAGSASASGGAPGSGTTYLTEFDLVDIGDDAAVGPEVSLQTHLFEDRVMKMSTVTVGAGATVGTRAIVLYDAVVGATSRSISLSLLMKGEHLAAGTRWRGIPAQHHGHTAFPAPVGHRRQRRRTRRVVDAA